MRIIRQLYSGSRFVTRLDCDVGRECKYRAVFRLLRMGTTPRATLFVVFFAAQKCSSCIKVKL